MPKHAILYIALVSHDDELEFVPLGVTFESPLVAKKYCEENAEYNNEVIVWEESPLSHSRIAGECWNGYSKQEPQYKYYVRPQHVLIKDGEDTSNLVKGSGVS
jgi:hypothetical protein